MINAMRQIKHFLQYRLRLVRVFVCASHKSDHLLQTICAIQQHLSNLPGYMPALLFKVFNDVFKIVS